MLRRGGNRNRIGTEARLCPKGRDDTGLGGGHAHPHHILLRCQHGVVPHCSEVTPVVHGDNAHTDRLGLVDGNAHGLGTEDDPEPPITVDGGGAG